MRDFVSVVALFAFLMFAQDVCAQTILQVDVRATYLRTRSDDTAAVAPTPIAVASIGAQAGQWLFINTQGAYSSMGQDNMTFITCVFSATGTVLAQDQQQRIPGALSAGPTFVTGVQGAANDIGQDFIAPAYVRVPLGAQFLFFSPIDSFRYGDNVDPNGDFRIVIQAVPSGQMPGTNEHCLLRSGLSPAPATRSPDRYLAPANSLLVVSVADAYSSRVGDIVLLMGELIATPASVPGPALPDIYLGPTAVVVAGGVVGSTPLTNFFFIPPGLAGGSLLVQAAFVGPAARNGIFMSSDAHLIDF